MNGDKCTNCNKPTNKFTGPHLLAKSKVAFINKYLDLTAETYCTNCGKPLLRQLAYLLSNQRNNIERRLRQIIHFIPVISSPAPAKWDYDIIGLVTSQTTSGTGFATELSRAFNDFFGTTSKTTNQKIANATELCTNDLRIQCVRSGGNTVISANLDFNEIGSGSTNMLMLCMSGTAIKVIDMLSFNSEQRDTIAEAIDLIEQLEIISEQL